MTGKCVLTKGILECWKAPTFSSHARDIQMKCRCLQRLLTATTKRRGWMNSTPASYPEGPGLKSRPADRLCYLGLSGHFSVRPESDSVCCSSLCVSHRGDWDLGWLLTGPNGCRVEQRIVGGELLVCVRVRVWRCVGLAKKKMKRRIRGLVPFCIFDVSVGRVWHPEAWNRT
jgi:hypothetical protein